MSSASDPLRDVLLVGFGGVGTICEIQLRQLGYSHHPDVCKDSLILKRSGLARVTAVARSNHDIVSSACFCPLGSNMEFVFTWILDDLEEGVHFKSAKYGEIRGWKPDRRKLKFFEMVHMLTTTISIQCVSRSKRQPIRSIHMLCLLRNVFLNFLRHHKFFNLYFPQLTWRNFRSLPTC